MKVGTLYLCIGHIVPSTLLFIEKSQCLGTIVMDSKIELWHKKLGHMSEKGMKILHSKKVL